ncbi:hypothetical protein TIFTF001_030009 [Ficus carica]|uniref:Uncharacterized protein n=1 Tax=Ficus carica TaxID=3494 RepID=A0AA88DWU0_FICCA|nr:hypothetical protein TIFTF001_030009 [Ficus carica]
MPSTLGTAAIVAGGLLRKIEMAGGVRLVGDSDGSGISRPPYVAYRPSSRARVNAVGLGSGDSRYHERLGALVNGDPRRRAIFQICADRSSAMASLHRRLR